MRFATNEMLVLISVGHRRFMLYDIDGLRNFQIQEMGELRRIQVGDNRSGFMGVRKGVELGQDSYLGQEER